jgi:hypothetical protein
MSENEKLDFVRWSEKAVAQILDNANISHRQLLVKFRAIEFDANSLKKLAANKSVEHFISLLYVVEILKAELANKTTDLFKEIDDLRESYSEMCEGYETKIKKLQRKKAAK